MEKGLIIKSLSGEYDCIVNDKIITCKPLGLFRFKKISPKVGDNVLVENNSIMEILPRKNDLVRPVVANVTKAFIITSVIEPDLNLNLLDRLICNIEYNNIEGILIFSKMDLINNDDRYNNIFNYYKNLGYKIYLLPEQADLLKEEIKDNICVLVGQSGVGKSTFVNLLSHLNIKTNIISQALGRGKHTTRHTELLNIASGWIADTPGFGTLDLEMDETTLSQTFKEFFETKCKYNGCLHIKEPGCNVIKKVENGEILRSRYDNYLSFIKEIRERPKKY